jgi:hypothetical protein
VNLCDRLLWVDARLVAKGFPALSPWWRAVLLRFFGGGCRRLVLRVGRRGGKSTSIVRALVVLAIWGEHKIQPGDVGVVAIVSTNKDEASQRLRLVRACLDALDMTHSPIDGGLECRNAQGKPVAFKVYAASVGAVSGFTAIGILCDEASKWKDSDSGTNPAAEVLASLRPTMATQPTARMFLSSSPFGPDDAHARAFDEGETSAQQVAHAATWEANPSITEQQTRDDEPDPKIWAREYAAIPQVGVSSAFDPAAVDNAIRPMPAVIASGDPVLVMDPSNLRNDAFAYGVARWHHPASVVEQWVTDQRPQFRGVMTIQRTEVPPAPPFLALEYVNAFEPPVRADALVIAKRLVDVCRQYRVRTVHSDQREAFLWGPLLAQHGLRFYPHDWTMQSKQSAVERLRGWFRDSQILLPDHAKLRAQLHGFSERITASGNTTYGARSTGHDDFAALLVTAALADLEGQLGGSPLQRIVRRNLTNLPVA